MKLRIVRRHGDPSLEPYALDATPTNVVRGCKQVRWDSWFDLEEADAKRFTPIEEGGITTDYRDVKLKGYLSTFGGTDRDGDTVKPGAFKGAIRRFMRNPVLLVNHRNEVGSIAGKFTKVTEDERGLYVEADVSNSPTPAMRDVRWKIAEGVLRALSMGGRFHYDESGKTITQVDLWEGSLVPIPSNPDAHFSTRDLTQEELQTA